MTDSKKENVNENIDKLEDKKVEISVEEDIAAIFSDENLSEDFKKNAKAIFEAAVLSKVDEQIKILEENYQEKLEESIAAINENLVAKVDEYLEYVVGEWMEENKLAIESGIKSEIVEDFMTGLKNLFVEHYIEIPEEKVDMIEELASKVNELESELDKIVTENLNLSVEINTYKKDALVSEVSEGLSEVQIEKLKSLSENIEFVSEEDYKEKLFLTKKKYFSNEHSEAPIVKNQFDADDLMTDAQLSPVMETYVKNISRTLRK